MQAAIMNGVLMFSARQATEPTGTETISPDGELRPGLTEWDVTPGLLGFVAMFVIVVAVIFIMLNMSKKLRRVGHSTGSSHRVTALFDGERPTKAPARALAVDPAQAGLAAQSGATDQTGTLTKPADQVTPEPDTEK